MVADLQELHKASPNIIVGVTRDGTHMVRWEGLRLNCWLSRVGEEFLSAALLVCGAQHDVATQTCDDVSVAEVAASDSDSSTQCSSFVVPSVPMHDCRGMFLFIMERFGACLSAAARYTPG